MIPYVLNEDEIFFVLENQPYTITSDHEFFKSIVMAVEDANTWLLKSYLEKPKEIVVATRGLFTVTDRGHVYYNKQMLSSEFTDLIINKLKSGEERNAWYSMIEKIMHNPRQDILHEIFLWIKEAKLAIFDDGDILAFKRVRRDYKSIWDGKTENNLHTFVEMDRELCDENRDKTCSTGLHFCSYDYLEHFASCDGNRTLILKINPRDITSIPSDYNNQKGRCCKQYIWGEVNIDNNEHEEYFEENKKVVSEEEMVINAFNKHRSYTQAAKSLNMARSTFTKKHKKYLGYSYMKNNGTGAILFYNENDQVHCDNGPAIMRESGENVWMKFGDYHREDGPAAYNEKTGFKQYYLNGWYLSEEDWKYKTGRI